MTQMGTSGILQLEQTYTTVWASGMGHVTHWFVVKLFFGGEGGGGSMIYIWDLKKRDLYLTSGINHTRRGK